MAAKKNKIETYYINGKLALEICISIKADSLEDAISRSKELTERDFVEILGDFNDGKLRISGVFEEYKPMEI